MAKIMKLVAEDGTLAKTKGANPREVKSCFVRDYARLGWVVVPEVVDGKPNPEFLAPYRNSLKPPDGAAKLMAEATGAAPAPAPADGGKGGKTAKDRQAPPAEGKE